MAKLLHDEFQESDYVGIACEPNLIFTACNQLPVLGFILHDYLYGTHYAAEVIPKFKAKWVSEHYVDPQTQSVMAFRMKTQQKNIYGSSAWQDGWAGMFMHAWDPTYIESIYPAQKQNHLPILFGHSDVAGGQFEERLGLAFFAALASEVGDTALVKQALESV